MTSRHNGITYLGPARMADGSLSEDYVIVELSELREYEDAQSARIKELKMILYDKSIALAETWALVLSHEGHIEKLNARIAELETALRPQNTQGDDE